MTYYRLMATHPPFPPEIWDRTPHEAQAYLLALEAYVATDGVRTAEDGGSHSRGRVAGEGDRGLANEFIEWVKRG